MDYGKEIIVSDRIVEGLKKTEPKNEIILKVNVDDTNLDGTVKKAQHLVELLKEAKSLADDLASSDVNINLEVDI